MFNQFWRNENSRVFWHFNFTQIWNESTLPSPMLERVMQGRYNETKLTSKYKISSWLEWIRRISKFVAPTVHLVSIDTRSHLFFQDRVRWKQLRISGLLFECCEGEHVFPVSKHSFDHLRVFLITKYDATAIKWFALWYECIRVLRNN